MNLEGGDNELGAEEAADGSITVSGTAQPGTTVTVSWLDNSYDSVTDADGNYSVDVPVSDLSEGASQISVVARNENGVSDVVTVDVDVSGLVDIPVVDNLLGTNDLAIVTDGDSLTIGQQESDLSATSDASVSSDNVVSVNLSSILDDNGSAAAI